jgi:hypothetical protein
MESADKPSKQIKMMKTMFFMPEVTQYIGMEGFIKIANIKKELRGISTFSVMVTALFKEKQRQKSELI